jgi:hypothetical protein
VSFSSCELVAPKDLDSPVTARKNTLIKLNKQFKVPSVRNPPSLPVITSLVAQAIEEDVLGRHGPTTVQRMIAREHNVIVPR